MKRRNLVWLLLTLLVVTSQTTACWAHFIWIVCRDGKAHIYFSESASPDDPDLLQRIAAAEVWNAKRSRQGEEKFVVIPVTVGEESLVGDLPKDATVLGLSHHYGVMSRGDETFKLCYYAKTYAPQVVAWDSLETTQRLPLEITPQWNGSKLVLTVTWQGELASDVEVVVSGAGVEEKLSTDKAGQISITPTESGEMSIRAKLVEQKAGSENKQDYQSVRHYSTLALPVTPPTTFSMDHRLPDLPKGITSLGAAIVGDHLYTYGGHFGRAHHYSTEGQSGEFSRLSLTNPTEWETLPGGPKLTGLAMVAWGDKLYRVGGFTAKNGDEEEQALWSQDSFAVFAPATKTWTDLPPLPQGRSSHDAAVLDNKLYVVGGWCLRGDDDATEWHQNGLMCDLTKPELKWAEFPVPFKRRALSVAAHQGKLYVLGGMSDGDGPVTRVDIYDPASQTWSEGPSLLGGPMDGFGTSAFSVDGRLLTSTMSGTVQRLSKDGKAWELVGRLEHPRFFHRLLPTAAKQAVIVGGASMETGKALELELLSSDKPQAVEETTKAAK